MAEGWALERPVYAEEEPPKGQQRLRGFVKSYCPFKRRGSVRVQGGKNVVAREFFIDADEAVKCDELSVGAAISFALKANRQGQPRACDINTLIKGIPQRAFVEKLANADDKVDWNKTYVGRIVWFLLENHDAVPASLAKKDPGYGWISCDETHKMFGYDVWAYPSKLAGCKVGDWISFKVSIDYYWSWPVARDIKPALPPNNDPLSPGGATASKAVGAALARSLESVISAMPKSASVALAQTLDDVITQMEAAGKAQSAVQDDKSTEVRASHSSNTSTTAAASDDPTPQPVSPTAMARDEGFAEVEPQSSVVSQWQRYAAEDGQGFWWYRESDGEFFLENNPGPWTKYMDPSTERHYWWKDEETWFWV